MKTGEIKQLFYEYAKKLPSRAELAALDEARKPGPVEDSLLIRGNLVLEGKYADDYFRMLEAVNWIAKEDGTWSKPSIDDLLIRTVVEVIGSSPEARAETIRTQSKHLVESLNAPPSQWVVDLQVGGITYDCAGISFGKLEFRIDTVAQGLLPKPVDGTTAQSITVAFARVTVAAVDEKSATPAAERLIDEHLAVLNELCVDGTPSRIHIYRGEEQPPVRQFARRVRKTTEAEGSHGREHRIRGTSLSRAELENFIQLRGGARVSEWLAMPTPFGSRILAAYVTAGSAGVEQKPFLAFLLFAIALESVVLGGEKNEITFQLSVRVAHLLGKTAETRKAIAERVRNLYKIRSTIAHEGERDVSESDLEQMKVTCLACLYVLTAMPDFAQMEKEKELDDWFHNRLLGGS